MAEHRSAWAWVGMGCLAVALVAVVLTVGGSIWLYRGAQRLEDQLTDPVERTAKAKQVLGVDELPEGYHAMLALSVPFGLMQMALLSSTPPDATGRVEHFGERGLVYIEMFSVGQDEDELRDYFTGKTDDPGVLRRNRINIDVEEVIRRGVVSSDRASLMYVAQRGTIDTHGYSADGITSIVLIDCPDDRRLRMAIWFGPDQAPGKPAEELDLSGTPADEAALAGFFDGFAFCE